MLRGYFEDKMESSNGNGETCQTLVQDFEGMKIDIVYIPRMKL